MSATSSLLQKALPATKSKSTLPASKTTSASAALLKAAAVPADGLKYVPQSEQPQPEKKQSTLGKVGSFVGGLAKGLVEPVTTLLARPIQAAAELGGATEEQVNAASAKIPFGLVAPVPHNFADVEKDVGRGVQTAALGIPGATLAKTVAGGAAFGLGSSLEQGNKVLSTETLKDVAIGGATAGALHGVFSGISKLLGKDVSLATDKGIFDFVSKDENGGITIDKSGKVPKEGYVVSPSKITETRIPSSEFKPSDIADFKKKFATELKQPGAHLGIWSDGEDKVLDVSHVTTDINEALAKGKAGSQDAIWDIKKGEAIPVNPKATLPTPEPKLSATEKLARYSLKQGYEPYQKSLPTIDAGSTPSSLPTIQIGAKENPFPGKIPGYKYEPIKAGVPEIPEAPMSLTNIPETATKTVTKRLPSVAGDTVTKEANDINTKLVQSGFEALAPEEKAKFNAITEKDQIEKVTNYMNTEGEVFKENVLNGKVPKDVHPQVAFNAVKNQAIKEGDYATIRALAKSPIATQESLAGQTLRASQILNDAELDPVKLIQRNDAALEESFQKKTGETVEQATKKEVKAAIEKKPKLTLKDFIRDIPEC